VKSSFSQFLHVVIELGIDIDTLVHLVLLPRDIPMMQHDATSIPKLK
jgi:hypothetical protein